MTKICAIDFETANASMLSACSIGVTVIEDGILSESWSTLIHPPKTASEFSIHNIMIHGITPKMVEHAPEFPEIYKQLLGYMKDAVLCAHNAEFDMKVLRCLCEHYRLHLPETDYFCTVRLSRSALPFLQRHRLNTVSDYFGIELNHHDASSDARACALIVLNIMSLCDLYEIKPMLAAYRQTLKPLKRQGDTFL